MRKLRAMLVLLAVVLCLSGNAAVKAAAKSKTNEWAAAYLKIAKKYNKEDKKSTSGWYGPSKFDLIYFDADKIPEFVAMKDNYINIYTYDTKTKKTVILLKDLWCGGAGGNLGYAYYPKKSKVCHAISAYMGMVLNYEIQVLKNGKLKKLYSLSELRFHDKNNNRIPDPDKNETYADKSTAYYKNKKKISEKKFESLLKVNKQEFLYGNSTYTEIKKKLEAEGA